MLCYNTGTHLYSVRGQQQHWHGQDKSVTLSGDHAAAIVQVLTFTAEETTAALAWSRQGVTLSGDLLCYNTGTHLYIAQQVTRKIDTWACPGVTLSGDLLCYNTGTHLYS